MAKKSKVVDYNDVPETLENHPFYGLELDEEQKMFRDAIWSKDKLIVFCNAKAGTGKAQPIDTIIPTPVGYKKIGELKVGDFVFDREGNPTKVLGVFPQGKQKAYKVTLSDGRSTICCDEHLWTYYRNNDGVAITETLNSMMKREIINSSNASRYNIPTNKALKYTTKKLPVDPYIVGLFLGDGCCREKYLTLSSENDELPSKVASILNAEYCKYSENNYSWCFKVSNSLLKTADIFGEIPEILNYSYDKSIPPEYLYGDIEQRFALLQGMMDTDGGISVAGYRYNMRYSTSSLKMAKDFVTLCRSLGIKATIHEDVRDKYKVGICYTVCLLCENEIKEKCFRLQRKVDIAKKAKSRDKKRKYNQIAIRNIEDLGYECDMCCIYVDNPEHLYLTNDCIVTHNTTIATGVADLLVKYGRYDGIVYIAAPVQEAKQGFLPGSIEDKSAPYYEPFYQALDKIGVNINTATFSDFSNEKFGTAYIKCMVHTYMRGCNFENKVVILDESQNYYFDELKKVLTRMHDNCKVVVIGHSQQCDLYHNPERSGFVKYLNHFSKDDRCAVCNLTKNYRGWISNMADELE